MINSSAKLDQIGEEVEPPQPDLVLVEYSIDVCKALERLRSTNSILPNLKVLMLDVPDNDADALASIEVGGASGYLLCTASVDDLIRSVRAVLAGETVCSPRVANLAFVRLSGLTRHADVPWANHSKPLTRRELDIVASIEKGLSNKEIAVHLGIEVSTVKNHVHNILDKLQLQDRRSAAKYVKQQSLPASRF